MYLQFWISTTLKLVSFANSPVAGEPGVGGDDHEVLAGDGDD